MSESRRSTRQSSRMHQQKVPRRKSSPSPSPPPPPLKRPRYLDIVDPDTDDENDNTITSPALSQNLHDNHTINKLSQELKKLSQSDEVANKMDCDDEDDIELLYHEIDEIEKRQDTGTADNVIVKKQRSELSTSLSQSSKTSWVEVYLSQENTTTQANNTTNLTTSDSNVNVIACNTTTTTTDANSIDESFKIPVVPVQPRAPSRSRSKSQCSSSSRHSSSSSTSAASSQCSSTSKKTSSGRSVSAGFKKFEGQNTRTRTIQMGLKTLLQIKNTQSEKYHIYQKIIDIVKRTSEWRIASSIFTEFCINHENGIILNLIATGDPVQVISNCFKILIKNSRIKCHEAILDLVNEYDELRPEPINKKTQKIKVKHDMKNLSRIVDSVVMEYIKNFKTNLLTHGYKHLKHFIQDDMKVTHVEAKKIIDTLFLQNKHPDIQLFDDFENLDFKLFNKKENWNIFVPFFAKLQKLTKNKFVLVPINKFGWAHVHISSSILTSLEYLFFPKVKGQKKPIIHNNLWEEVFGINKDTPFGEKFGESLSTNGAEVSILQYVENKVDISNHLDKIEKQFENKIISEDKIEGIKILSNVNLETIKKTKYTRINCIDPGERVPFATVIVKNINDFGDKNKEYRYCQKNSTFLYKSGFFSSEKKRKKITGEADKNVENITKLKEFNDPNNKVELNLKNADNYKSNLKYRLLCYYELQHVYGQLKYVLNRWHRKIQLRRAFDRQVNFLAYGLGSKKNIKKPIIPDEIKKQKNLKIHDLKQARKQKYKLEHPDADKNKDKTKSKIKKEKKIYRQEKLAEKHQATLSNEEKKRREKNRKQELEKKIKNKNLKKQLNIQKALNFKRKQEEYQLRKKNYQQKLNNNNNNNNHHHPHVNTNNEKVLILIGETKMMPGIRGYRHPPLLKIERKLLKMEDVTVVRVDEYRTTQNCSVCFQQLVVSTDGHRYCFCPHCKITWNRDLNAARNIGGKALAHLGINKKHTIDNYINFKRGGRKKN